MASHFSLRLTSVDGFQPNVYRLVVHACLVGAGYYAGTRLGLALTPASFPISPLWPPNAILFAALLLVPYRIWPLFLIAVLPAHLLAQFESGVPLMRSIGWYISNTSEALLGAICVRRFYKGLSWFDTFQGVAIFLLFGGLMAPLVTTFLDAGVVALTGWESGYWTLWEKRLLSNILSNLAIVPAIVIAGLRGVLSFRNASVKRVIEATLLVAVMILISHVLFRTGTITNRAYPAFILPPLLWAAVRFGPGGVSACVLSLALVSSWNLVRDSGSFSQVSLSDNLFSVHLFLIIISITLMSLAAVLREKYQVLEALRDSEDRMNMAVASANLGFYRQDFSTNKIWLSDHCRQMLGLNEDAVTLETLVDLIHPDDRQRVVQTFNDARAGGHTYEVEYPLLLTGGRVRWMHDRAHIDRDAAGFALSISGVILDITERKTAELEAQMQLQELRHLTRVSVLGQLSGSLAHELNQPLTAILSNAQTAQRFLSQPVFDPEEIREILHDIVEEDRRAGAVIQRLRSLLMKEEREYQSLDINEVITEILFLTRSDAITRNVTVKTNLEASLPRVVGDSVQLQQVVLNLVLNACEAMDGYPISDRVIVVASRTDKNGQIRLSFQDYGPGIILDDLERIFEPFVTTKQQGLGLGLTICRSIISAHGGCLTATNNADRGATFHISLPVEN